jgi:hypothetical protein
MTFEDRLGNLDSNFLFQASLGSKELFHSNMLAWILKQEDENGRFPALEKFIKQFTRANDNVEIKSRKDFKIFREKSNLDLVVAYRQKAGVKFVVIENKVKSVPTNHQLLKYNHVISNLSWSAELLGSAPKNKAICEAQILLCMIEANSELPSPWISSSYKKDFLEFLQSIKNCRFKNPDVRSVIENYIPFLKDFISVFEAFKIDFKNGGLYDFYDVVYPEGRGAGRGNRIELLRDLRIRDVILKYVHDQISLEVHDRLQNKNIELKINRAVGEFSNSTGISTISILFNIDKKIDKKVEIGLQLQHNELRYFVSSSLSSTKNRKKTDAGSFNAALSQQLLNKRLWFCDINGELLEAKKRSKQDVDESIWLLDNHCFYKFDKVFLYLKDPVKRGTSLDSLVERMAQVLLENVWNEKVAIQRIIDDIARGHKIV